MNKKARLKAEEIFEEPTQATVRTNVSVQGVKRLIEVKIFERRIVITAPAIVSDDDGRESVITRIIRKPGNAMAKYALNLLSTNPDNFWPCIGVVLADEDVYRPQLLIKGRKIA